MLPTHNENDYNNDLINTFNKLSIGTKYNIIGSSALKSNLYFNDYDLHNYFKSNDKNILNKITNHFKKLFKDSYKDTNTWILDLKCGFDPNYNVDELSSKGTTKDNYKLRWDRHDIEKGYKILKDGTKKYFKDCILDKTMMKIDYVILLNGQFIDLSENYNFSIKGKTNEVAAVDLKNELQKEVEKYKKENLFKSFKREFSLLKLEGKNKKKMDIYVELFNSKYGYMNNIINQLKTISIMLEQHFRPVKLSDICNNLQILKQNLSFFNTKDLSNEIDRICKEKSKINIHQSLERIINYLTAYLNNQLKKVKI